MRRTVLGEGVLGMNGTPTAAPAVIPQIEAFCDAVPRLRARAEEHSP
jgi:hypothetical protein